MSEGQWRAEQGEGRVPRGWIELHDAEVSKRKYPNGRPILVWAGSVTALRGYPDGRERCVVSLTSNYHLHTIETEEQVIQKMNARSEKDRPRSPEWRRLT